MKTIPSDVIEILLSDPETRLRLAFSYPKSRCVLCQRPAHGVYAVAFSCEADDSEWTEYVLGCSACFFSDLAKGLKSTTHEPPLVGMRVWSSRLRRYVFIKVPAPIRRERVAIILPIQCASSIPGMMKLLET